MSIFFGQQKMSEYVERFNRDDNEYVKQAVDNAHAADWMRENIPAVDLPDKTLEEIYYFRFWTFRKHLKETPDGHVITEFQPPVVWAGTYNTIIAAAGFHIAEGKWMKCAKSILRDYISLWLDEKSRTYSYSNWLAYAVYEYCLHTGDRIFGANAVDRLVHIYETVSKCQKTPCGLFWSIDSEDAMEYSISGVSSDGKTQRGIRPTLNSYMAINAFAISEMAKWAGKLAVAETYAAEYADLKEKITAYLWDGSFYRAIHPYVEGEDPSLSRVADLQNARELIGYIPFWFGLAPSGYANAFRELWNADGFYTEYGFTTAEKRHPRFLYEADHECLWNGYIWPFATSETLYAMMRVMNDPMETAVTKEDFYKALSTYARAHHRVTEEGKTVLWIDEVKHPVTDTWSSRELLKEWGWLPETGGFERGKDYNHSAYCDILLSGLLGITVRDGDIHVAPQIPDDWTYFAVENITVGGDAYRVAYDKDGKHYGHGAGITVSKM